jgi:hypothetical protein
MVRLLALPLSLLLLAAAVAAPSSAADASPGGGAASAPDTRWFDRGETNVLIPVLIFTGLVSFSITAARRGTAFVRRISGLDAIDEAIGRATEMGKPILYSPGLDEMDQAATVASMSILGRIAEKAASYDTHITVPNRDPIVMSVAQDVVRSGYLRAGRPDLYREEDVYYVTYSQFGYAAGVVGYMVRARPQLLHRPLLARRSSWRDRAVDGAIRRRHRLGSAASVLHHRLRL